MPVVLDQLPHVATSTVLPAAAPRALRELRLALRDRVAEGVRRCRARPRRIFPLGLAEQTVDLSRLARQPRGVLLRIGPGHVDHRPTPSAPSLIAQSGCSRRGPRKHPTRRTRPRTCLRQTDGR